MMLEVIWEYLLAGQLVVKCLSKGQKIGRERGLRQIYTAFSSSFSTDFTFYSLQESCLDQFNSLFSSSPAPKNNDTTPQHNTTT
jgi:hypothetical protein